jgi:hypothetical protein
MPLFVLFGINELPTVSWLHCARNDEGFSPHWSKFTNFDLKFTQLSVAVTQAGCLLHFRSKLKASTSSGESLGYAQAFSFLLSPFSFLLSPFSFRLN